MENGNAFLCNQDLWHRRVGHCNDEGLAKMRDGCVKGVNYTNKSKTFCEVCIKGKHARQPFHQSNSKTNGILELIHSDLCGPMHISSFGNSRYMLTFVDDFSGKLFVYFLKNKSETFTKFKEFKIMIEKRTDKFIKTFRTDNGGEFCSGEIEHFLTISGIVHQYKAPYTPQQNGKAERINRTIIEKARCLMIDAGMDKKLWAEAVSTAAHIYNKTESRVLNYRSPEEVFSNRKPNLKYMQVFGASAMVHCTYRKT